MAADPLNPKRRGRPKGSFKKSPCRLGGVATPVPEQGVRFQTRQTIKTEIDRQADYEVERVKEIANDPKSKMLEAVIAQFWLDARAHGDKGAMAFLMDRSIGRVPEPKEEDSDVFKPEKYTPRESMIPPTPVTAPLQPKPETITGPALPIDAAKATVPNEENGPPVPPQAA